MVAPLYFLTAFLIIVVDWLVGCGCVHDPEGRVETNEPQDLFCIIRRIIFEKKLDKRFRQPSDNLHNSLIINELRRRGGGAAISR
jgi:hypothetical protein